MRSPLTLILLTVLAATGRADIVTGIVRDTGGNPVVGANIDAFVSATGVEVTLVNDTTAADGSFAITVPANTYDIAIHPLLGSALVGRWRNDIVVAGVANTGVTTLLPGVNLSGHYVRPGGGDAAGTKLEVEIAATGEIIALTTDTTSLTGTFSDTVPLGALILRANPGVLLPLAAPKEQVVNVAGPINLGNIQLVAGHLVSLTVLRPGGLPLAGADIDAISTTTGLKLYTPSDNPNATGLADFVVPTGVYDIDICAPFAEQLASMVVPAVAVNGTTNLGMFTLQAGRVLSGTVTGAQGQPLVGIDIEAFLPGSATEVPVCNDNSGPGGAYQVVLPIGTFDIMFRDVETACGASRFYQGVNLTNNTTLNAALTGFGCLYCFPSNQNSTGQRALITATGSFVASANNTRLIATGLPQNQFGIFITSTTQGFVANPGGSHGNLCLGGAIGRYNAPGQILNSGASGSVQLLLNLPSTPTPSGPVAVVAGVTRHFQCWYRDLQPTPVSNFSNAITVVFQ